MMLNLGRRTLLAAISAAPFMPKAAAAATVAIKDIDAVRRRVPLVLLRTRVNGERYYQARESVATLAAGDILALRREPYNAFDRRAIEVFDQCDRKLGYVPRIDNSAVARMMDAGERMQARVTAVDARFRDIAMVVEWLRA